MVLWYNPGYQELLPLDHPGHDEHLHLDSRPAVRQAHREMSLLRSVREALRPPHQSLALVNPAGRLFQTLF